MPVLVILGNPKAILFYLGILPGFFDISVLTTIDITMVVIISVGAVYGQSAV